MKPLSRRSLLESAAALVAAIHIRGAWAATQPVSADNPAPDLTIEGQRRRARRVLETIVAVGERHYDERVGLIVRGEYTAEPQHWTKYSGSWVAWKSPNYAYALLETGQHVDRARRILSRICDHLERDADSPSYGNVYGISEWKAVRDSNAIVFAMSQMVPIWMHHRERLPADLQDRLRDFLEVGSIGVARRQPVWWYSNIALLTISAEVMLAKVLARDDLARMAAQQWQQWLEGTVACSLSEYNSPAYYLHQIGPLLAIAEHAPNETVRLQATHAADLLFVLLAGNYHAPSGMLGGTTTRAYMENALYGYGDYESLMHLYFGVPLRPELTDPASDDDTLLGATNITPHPHPVPEVARRLVWERTYPDTLITRYGSYFGKDDAPVVITCTNYQTGDYSVGSQRGVWSHYRQDLPLFITYRGLDRRRTMSFHGGPDWYMIDTHFAQQADRLLGITYWNPHDRAMLKLWWKDATTFLMEHRLFLGNIDTFTTKLLDDQPIQGPMPVSENSTLLVARPEIRLALRVVPPPGVRRPTTRIDIGENRELQLVIEYARAENADTFLALTPAAIGMLIHIDKPGTESPRDVVRLLRGTDISSTLRPDGYWQLAANNELRIEAPVTPQARAAFCKENGPPIREAFIEHPLISLRDPQAMREWLGMR